MITAKNPCGNTAKSLYEGLNVSFLTQLDHKSYKLVSSLITKTVTVTDSNLQALIKQPNPKPIQGNYINLEGFWLPLGSLEPIVSDKVR